MLKKSILLISYVGNTNKKKYKDCAFFPLRGLHKKIVGYTFFHTRVASPQNKVYAGYIHRLRSFPYVGLHENSCSYFFPLFGDPREGKGYVAIDHIWAPEMARVR